jgi:hypothetical protein
MKESRKEFIKQGHKAACSEWKEKIEKEFPKLFKKNALVVGKYYKLTQDYVNLKKDNIFEFLEYQTSCKTFAIVRHSVFDNSKTDYAAPYSNTLIPATDKEVEEALIKEAKNRGFKEGVKFINLDSGVVQTVNRLPYFELGRLAVKSTETEWSRSYKGGSSNPSIFEYGKWATIVETITKEQAEKELGKAILN